MDDLFLNLLNEKQFEYVYIDNIYPSNEWKISQLKAIKQHTLISLF